MATLRTRWLLAILLVNLPNCCVATDASGTSAPPAHLECYFPCNEEICCVNIHCHWKSALDAQIPRNYSLHWDPAISKGYVTSQTGSSGIIYREDFANNGELHVWVKSTSQHGSVISHDDVFSIADIIKPPPPNVMPLCQQRSIEIEWISFCDKLGFSLGNCDFRYRFNYQVWLEHESGFYHMHTIESPQPCTVFEVQVRCACEIGLMSDWSPIQNLTCAETNPIGKPDIWWDCGTSPVSFNCALTWKNLAMSQPCSVLGYEVKLFYNNNTTVPPQNLSVPLCNEMRCHLNTSLKDVTSFNVSAYNNHGATEPSQLIMPIPGIRCPDCCISKEGFESGAVFTFITLKLKVAPLTKVMVMSALILGLLCFSSKRMEIRINCSLQLVVLMKNRSAYYYVSNRLFF